MWYFWWGCRRNLALMNLRSWRGNEAKEALLFHVLGSQTQCFTPEPIPRSEKLHATKRRWNCASNECMPAVQSMGCLWFKFKFDGGDKPEPLVKLGNSKVTGDPLPPPATSLFRHWLPVFCRKEKRMRRQTIFDCHVVSSRRTSMAVVISAECIGLLNIRYRTTKMFPNEMIPRAELKSEHATSDSASLKLGQDWV